jgi:hypothetical protein
MAKLNISETTIFRFRYIIGSSLVIIGLVAALVFVGVYLPGGISKDEIQSVITSNSIDFTKPSTLNIVDLPYHLLQKLSIDLFGVRVFSIKLITMFVIITINTLSKKTIAIATKIRSTTERTLFNFMLLITLIPTHTCIANVNVSSGISSYL